MVSCAPVVNRRTGGVPTRTVASGQRARPVGPTIVFCGLPTRASGLADDKRRSSAPLTLGLCHFFVAFLLIPTLLLAQPSAKEAAAERANVRRIAARIQTHAKDPRPSYRVTIPNTTIAYGMVAIPAGEFVMGSAARKDEQPPHKVRLDAFWMQAHEVTWDEYRLFMFATQAGETGRPDDAVDAVSRPTRPYVEMSFGMGIHGFPAISMTQHAANKYAEWLSAKTGEFYRLPTEAEWEYACRAGDADAAQVPSSTNAPDVGQAPSPANPGPHVGQALSPANPAPASLSDFAWYAANSDGKYHPVAGKKPNAWGLYDMLGNVMEWTLDRYAPYQPGNAVNPWVRAAAPYPHAVRGGSWNDPSALVTCAARVASDASWKQQDPQLPKSIWYMTDAPWLGFRLVRPARVPGAEEMYQYWNNGVEHDER